ncbi:hypothetical protein QQF64_001745 [Cirrhinus molitorella]|uniref:Uncharacterized protein n=1 Tax=Cirrhinus molitorella TaxID=172907 RepID=A0ABR3P1D8_9TELE
MSSVVSNRSCCICSTCATNESRLVTSVQCGKRATNARGAARQRLDDVRSGGATQICRSDASAAPEHRTSEGNTDPPFVSRTVAVRKSGFFNGF